MSDLETSSAQQQGLDGQSGGSTGQAPPMQLYDTSRRAVVAFSPGRDVSLYVCGITPYDATHIGHAFTFLAYDVLARRLVDRGHVVRMVRNVTDVDDPLFAKARDLAVDWRDLADREEARFEADVAALGLRDMEARPHVSSSMADIAAYVQRLIEVGVAYRSGGSVYADVARFSRFGEVSHLDGDAMLALARERGGNVDDVNKRNPLDFVLWQPSAPDEPTYDAPWGAGRPGWHIGCATFILRELGPTIDLHGGGADLIFPHHECERAISESVNAGPFVRHWMHVAMVWKDGHKMSKSLGNLVFVDALRERHDARAIRLALLAHHYRAEWSWTDDVMPAAEIRLQAWQAASRASASAGAAASERALLDEVRAALDHDLDTPLALRAIDAAAAQGVAVAAAAGLLGVTLS